MVKDHSDSERGNLLLPHGLLFPINSKGSFICTIPQTGWYNKGHGVYYILGGDVTVNEKLLSAKINKFNFHLVIYITTVTKENFIEPDQPRM